MRHLSGTAWQAGGGVWSEERSFLAPPPPGGAYRHRTPLRPAGPSAVLAPRRPAGSREQLSAMAVGGGDMAVGHVGRPRPSLVFDRQQQVGAGSRAIWLAWAKGGGPEVSRTWSPKVPKALTPPVPPTPPA
jgi:hypothetical protein